MKASITLLLLLCLNTFVYSQVNCPLNTPEFPFTTDDWTTNYSWSANLYDPSQMGGAQLLTAISFRLDNDACNGCSTYMYSNCKIWVRNTAINDYASNPGYPGNAGFTEVYSGNFTFSGPGVYTMNFNVAPSFNYDGTSTFEVLFENQGGVDNTWDEPWFDRTDGRTDGVYPGKVGWGFSWANAMTISSNRLFNLQINGVTCAAYPLPVTLSSSTLDCYAEKIVLNWSTTSEVENDYFLIESSSDGIEWYEVTRIEGQGNSQSNYDYSATINKQQFSRTKINYFRLSQIDYNGEFEHLVTHSSDCSQNSIAVYPNPFSGELNIANSEGTQILILNALGQLQNVDPVFVDGGLVINTNGFRSGLYTLLIDGEAFRIIKD